VQQEQDPRARAELQRAIRRLELQLPPGPAGPETPRLATATATATATADATLTPQTPPEPASNPVAAASGAGAPAIDPVVLADPAEAYTQEVKGALIDAMLENSGPLGVGPDEWLTIAARDSEPGNRLVPGDAYDSTTWVLRVKGSDLAAFRSGRLTLEDARQRVEIKEF